MGVEPTRQHFSIRLIGFEDRGRHPPDNACHEYNNLFICHVRKEKSCSGRMGRRWVSQDQVGVARPQVEGEVPSNPPGNISQTLMSIFWLIGFEDPIEVGTDIGTRQTRPAKIRTTAYSFFIEKKSSFHFFVGRR